MKEGVISGLSELRSRAREVGSKLHILCSNAPFLIKGAPDGLPLPPSESVFLVTADYYIREFFDGVAEYLLAILEKNGLTLDDFPAILDFGCGCGRIIRNFKFKVTKAKLYATDYNPRQIEWCKQNLPFAEYGVNQLHPPLGYGDAKFDFIYALSVFTHLPEALQFLWMDDLSRVLKPGGYLLVTTHGESYLRWLSEDEKRRFRAGEMVMVNADLAGANECCSFHPAGWVTERLARGFEIIDFVEGLSGWNGFVRGLKKRPPRTAVDLTPLNHDVQDVYLLRKPLNAARPA